MHSVDRRLWRNLDIYSVVASNKKFLSSVRLILRQLMQAVRQIKLNIRVFRLKRKERALSTYNTADLPPWNRSSYYVRIEIEGGVEMTKGDEEIRLLIF